MKNFVLSLAVLLCTAGLNAQTMRYLQPASSFNEALPLGNGHIGAMIYGGVEDDLINLNEATLWGGSGADNNPVPDGPERLKEIREVLFREDWQAARQLLVPMQGPNAMCFLPMGDLHIRQSSFRPSRQDDNGPDTYLRTLSLDDAVARTEFVRNGVKYEREYFV
ncbi:MAG: glycoside hydrolase N-terminal domain-containing protein, partial [Bacteroidia bacterium]|nr:glycoside hydrolase N-terminal domain-containing protein [Bacteroidia bacterium]